VDDERFDGWIRSLGNGTSRRGALGILAGLAGLGLGEVAAKQHRHRGAPRRRGRVQSAVADKVAVCHYDAKADTHVVLRVSRRGWENGHAKHEGDFLRGGDNGGVGCCTDGECSALTNACGPGVCGPETGTCVAPCAVGEQCIGNACVAVCDDPFTGSRPRECSCFTRIGASGFACLRATGCSPTCTSDAQCTGGAVCALSPCCPLDLVPAGMGVCQRPCGIPDDCTCNSGRETCDPFNPRTTWVTCGVDPV
jgi:hypothetical protein